MHGEGRKNRNNKTFHNCYLTAFITLIIIVISTSCQTTETDVTVSLPTLSSLPLSSTPKSTTAPQVVSTAPPSSLPPYTSPLTDTAESITTVVAVQEEWHKFEDSVYGFSFTYPTDWTPIELPNRVVVTYQGSSISLRIWFKQVTEDTEILRSGAPAGDLVMKGTVTFLGQGLVKNILVYQGKDKAVFYNNAGEVQVGDFVFAISLESNRFDYESIVIPEAIQEQAEQILESFELPK